MPHGFGSRLITMKITLAQNVLLPIPAAETLCLVCGCRHGSNVISKEKETGFLVCAIGVFFIPLLVGIPILVFGLHLLRRKTSKAFCGQCGFWF